MLQRISPNTSGPTGPTGFASIRTRERRFGVAVLEFAVIAPVLVFVVIGMLELARGLQVKETLTDAARKGCRTALPSTGTNAAVTADINTVLTNSNLSSTAATIIIQVNGANVDVSTAAANTPISVKVAIPYSSTGGISGFFLTGASIESEKIVMMSQR